MVNMHDLQHGLETMDKLRLHISFLESERDQLRARLATAEELLREWRSPMPQNDLDDRTSAFLTQKEDQDG